MFWQANKEVLGPELGAPCSLVWVTFRLEENPAMVSNSARKTSTWVEKWTAVCLHSFIHSWTHSSFWQQSERLSRVSGAGLQWGRQSPVLMELLPSRDPPNYLRVKRRGPWFMLEEGEPQRGEMSWDGFLCWEVAGPVLSLWPLPGNKG